MWGRTLKTVILPLSTLLISSLAAALPASAPSGAQSAAAQSANSADAGTRRGIPGRRVDLCRWQVQDGKWWRLGGRTRCRKERDGGAGGRQMACARV